MLNIPDLRKRCIAQYRKIVELDFKLRILHVESEEIKLANFSEFNVVPKEITARLDTLRSKILQLSDLRTIASMKAESIQYELERP